MKIRTIGEVVADMTPPPSWLFEGFLRSKTLTVLGADRHAGKSVLMLDMAICLELNKPLFGHFKPARPRKTLFIGQDAPTWDYEAVIKKLLKGHGIQQEVGEMFDCMLALNEGVNLSDPAWWNPTGYESKILDLWNERQFDVLMLDTELEMHRWEENSAREMQQWGRVKKSLRDRLRLTVISSHHLAHAADGVPRRLRGSTTIGGTVDYEILLTPKDHRSKSPRRVALSCDKARGGTGEWPEAFQIEGGEDWIRLSVAPPEPPKPPKAGKWSELDEP